MLYEIFNNLDAEKDVRRIKALIGMGRAEFDKLALAFAHAKTEMDRERLQRGEIKRLVRGGKPGILDTPEKQLLFVLFYKKCYPVFDLIAVLFGLRVGHAHEYLQQFMPVLERSLKNLNALPLTAPESPQKFAQLVEKHDAVVVDCTECACTRPSDGERQKEFYSGKKKRHTLKILVLATLHQQILLASPFVSGRTHDYTMMKSIFDPKFNWLGTAKLLADSGFQGAQKDYSETATVCLPHKKPRKSKKNPDPHLTDAQKAENRRLAQARISVEHAIGRMKVYQCLAQRIRNRLDTLIDSFFLLAAGLSNFKLVTNQ